MKTLTERCEIELQALALGECEFADKGYVERIYKTASVDESSIFYWHDLDYRIKSEPRVFYGIDDMNGRLSNVMQKTEDSCYTYKSGEKIIKLIEVLE